MDIGYDRFCISRPKMDFDWKDFLTQARNLHTQSATSAIAEADQRSAVSRAYYAAFHCVLAWTAGKYTTFAARGSGDDHGYLRKFLKDQSKPHLATGLHTLRLMRTQCDYDAKVENLDSMCKRAFIEVDKLLKHIK